MHIWYTDKFNVLKATNKCLLSLIQAQNWYLFILLCHSAHSFFPRTSSEHVKHVCKQLSFARKHNVYSCKPYYPRKLHPRQMFTVNLPRARSTNSWRSTVPVVAGRCNGSWNGRDLWSPCRFQPCLTETVRYYVKSCKRKSSSACEYLGAIGPAFLLSHEMQFFVLRWLCAGASSTFHFDCDEMTDSVCERQSVVVASVCCFPDRHVILHCYVRRKEKSRRITLEESTSDPPLTRHLSARAVDECGKGKKRAQTIPRSLVVRL